VSALTVDSREVGARLGLHSGPRTDDRRPPLHKPDAVSRGAALVYHESGPAARARSFAAPDRHDSYRRRHTGTLPSAWPQLLRLPGQADVGQRPSPGPTVKSTSASCSTDLQGPGRRRVSSTPSASGTGPGVQAGQRHPRAGDSCNVCWRRWWRTGVEELVIEVSSQALGDTAPMRTDLDAAVLTNVNA